MKKKAVITAIVGSLVLVFFLSERFFWFNYRVMQRIGIYIEQSDQPLQHIKKR